MGIVGLENCGLPSVGWLALAAGLVVAGCQGSGSQSSSPLEEVAVLGTTVKFDSKTFGVPVSPRVTNLKRVPKGGGRSQVGKPYKVRGQWYYPKDEPGYSKAGKASWYGSNFHGRLTANGEVYDMHGLSAAHKTFPLPSYAMVTNLTTGSHVMVRVNDRGPYADGREIDVSSQAAELLDFKQTGTAEVRVDYVGRAPVDGDDTRMLMASYEPGSAAPGSSDAVMVAAAAPEGTATAMTGGSYGEASGLPGVGGAGAVASLAGRIPLPSSRDYSASYAAVEAAGGAATALSALASNAEPERIALGVVNGATLEKIRSVALGHGRLIEEAVPGLAGRSATLAVRRGEDADAILRRFWQIGADDAFVVRD